MGREVHDKAGLDILNKMNPVANAQALIKELNEISKNGIETEEQLNKLRLSNAKELGRLSLEQQQELLAATIAANEVAINQRLQATLDALQKEKEERLKFEEELTEEQKQQIEDEYKAKTKAAEKSAKLEKEKSAKDNKKTLEEVKEQARKAGDEYVNKLFGKDSTVVDRFAGIGKV